MQQNSKNKLRGATAHGRRILKKNSKKKCSMGATSWLRPCTVAHSKFFFSNVGDELATKNSRRPTLLFKKRRWQRVATS